MNSIENKSIVKRLHEGQCPRCLGELTYMSQLLSVGDLEKNGMPSTCENIHEKHSVFCDRCGYYSPAVQIGLKLIPIDRIIEFDKNWDKKYLEDNTLIYGEKGVNPFNKDKE